MRLELYKKIVLFFLIFAISLTSLPFDFLQKTISFYANRGNVVDKMWGAETDKNVVDNFIPFEKFLEKLKIAKAEAAATSNGTKWYLHATNAQAAFGTVGPINEQSAATDLVPAAPANKAIALAMNDSVGTAQTSVAGAETSATAGNIWFRTFVSPKLAVQTIPSATTFRLEMGLAENSTSANMIARIHVFQWREGTGKIASLIDNVSSTACGVEPGAAASERSQVCVTAGTAAAATLADGDQLALEIWVNANNILTTSYTGTIYFDGNGFIENGAASHAITSAASALSINRTLVLQTAAAATTTLTTGTNPGNSIIAPGGAITPVNGFTLTTSTGTDAITGIIINLSTNNGVGTLTITDGADVVLGSIGGGTGAGIVSGSNSIPISSTNATAGGTAFKVKVTPLSHTNMLPPAGGAYSITGVVTDWTGTNTKAGQAADTSSTVTIDNASPGATTGASATPGDAQVDVAWADPVDTDFQQIYIYCKTSSMISGEAPIEGTDPAVDATACDGTARMKYKGVDTASPQTISNLTNGIPYYFRIYARDTNGNFTAYSTTQQVSATPVAPVATTTLATSATDPAAQTIAPSATVQDIDQFTFTTSSGTDTITAITATLAPASSFDNIASVEITDASNVGKCTSITNPSSTTLSFTGCSLSVGTSATTFKIRVTPKTHVNMPAPSLGLSYATTAIVSSWTGTNSTHAGNDTCSNALTIDNLSPSVVTGATGTAGNAQVSLSWTNPADADFHSTVVLRGTGSAVTDWPAEGSIYVVGNTIGSTAIVACVVATPTASCIDSSLANGTVYYYQIFTKDSRGNYSPNPGVIPTGAPFTPIAPTTTIADGTDPSNSTIAPSAAITDLDAFTLVTNIGADSIIALTVTLTGANSFQSLSEVRITSDNGATLYFSAVANPASNIINFSGGTPISVSTSATQFKVRITPKTHINMPVPPGLSYAVGGTVTAFISTNAQAGNDSATPTMITIDNLSPNSATALSGSSGSAKVTLNWTASSSSDFNTTSGSVIYRWAAGSAGSEVPAEGSIPAIGAANGTATVACVVSSAISAVLSKIDGTGGSVGECTTSALTNGTTYTYKAFQKDTNGNYDVGVLIGSFTPNVTLTIAATAGSKVVNLDSGMVSQYANTATCNGAASCAAFTLSISGGTETITSIKITQNGTTSATDNLANLALFYDTDGNYSNGVTGQYGSTVAAFTSQAAAVSGSLAISSGTTYYFYVRFDLVKGAVYPKGGETINFQIAVASDVGTSGVPIKTGTPSLVGTTTVRPNATGITYGAGLSDGGRSGESITISGFGFGAPTAGANREDCTTATVDRGCIKFIIGGTTNVANINIISWSNTSISFTIAIGLATNGGALAVETRAGNQADFTPLDFYIYPNITSAPTNGQIGSEIAVTGDHFGASAGSIVINTKTAVVVGGWTATNLTVRIPGQEGVANITGKIQITRTGDIKTSNQYPVGNFTILSPSVSGSNPVLASVGDILTIEFTGQGIDTDAGTAPILKLTKGQPANCTASATCIFGTSYLKVTDYTVVSANFDLTGAATGVWSLVIVNMDTQTGAIGSFTVSAEPPTVTGIDPGFGANNGVKDILTVSGTKFQNGATVKLIKGGESDITPLTAFSWTSSLLLSDGQFNLTGKALGWWTVVVTNPDEQSASFPDLFEIVEAKPAMPTNIYQFKNNNDIAQPPTENIAVGGGVGGQTNIYFRMDMSGGLIGEQYYPQVELKPVGGDFECNNISPAICPAATGFFEGSGVTFSDTAVQGWVNIPEIDDGAYHWQARVKNSGGTSNWVSFGGNNDPNDIDIYLDNTAPTISLGTDSTCDTAKINITDLASDIKWNTDDGSPPGSGIFATAQVQYIKSSDFINWISTPGALTLISGWETSPHIVSVSGLSPGTEYTYRVRSKDSVGNETLSDALSGNCVFSTSSSRPFKTIELFIDQESDQNSGTAISKDFSVYIPESLNTIVYVRSAIIEVTGVSGDTGSQTVNIELRRGNGATFTGSGTDYTIDSIGTTTPFSILFDALGAEADKGNQNMTNIINGASTYDYTLFLNGTITPISIFSAKLILTYSYVL